MDSVSPSRPPRILMADDADDFVLITRMVFERAQRPVEIHHVRHGRACLDFLRRAPPYANAPEPDVVMLDLDMPIMDGRLTLEEIVADEAIRHVPVVVLSHHDEPDDVMRMYRLRCSAYLRKPAEYKQWVELVTKFFDFWLASALLPSRIASAPDPSYEWASPKTRV